MLGESRSIPQLLAMATTVYLAAGIIGFGLRRSDYSHIRNTISELGEYGAADSALVSWGIFLPVGLATIALSFLFLRRRRSSSGAIPAAALAVCIAVGYTVAAFFPCDPGAPLNGSVRTGIHNMGGAVEYFMGGLALAMLAFTSPKKRWIYAIATVFTFGAAIGLAAGDLDQWRGLLQRFGEASLFGSLILGAGLTHRPKIDHG